MFDISDRFIVSLDYPLRHFEAGLEYETSKINVWILSHNKTTIGFLTYLVIDERLVVHLLPPALKGMVVIQELALHDKLSNEAVFIARSHRHMGAMSFLFTNLFTEANHLLKTRIDLISIGKSGLLQHLEKLLESAGYNHIYVQIPPEQEGGNSIIARKATYLK